MESLAHERESVTQDGGEHSRMELGSSENGRLLSQSDGIPSSMTLCHAGNLKSTRSISSTCDLLSSSHFGSWSGSSQHKGRTGDLCGNHMFSHRMVSTVFTREHGRLGCVTVSRLPHTRVHIFKEQFCRVACSAMQSPCLPNLPLFTCSAVRTSAFH
jgi:hypothetical protein